MTERPHCGSRSAGGLIAGSTLPLQPLPLAYLLWKPGAVILLFWRVWRYLRRTLAGLWERRVAVVVALFFTPPAAALGGSFGTPKDRAELDFIAGEGWAGGHVWDCATVYEVSGRPGSG